MKQTLLLSACCGLIGLNSAIADDYTPPGGYYSAPDASNAPYNSYQQPIGGQPQSLYGNPGYVAPRSDYGSANQDDRGIHINPMNMMNRMFGSSNQRDDYGRNDRYYAPPAQYDRGNNYAPPPRLIRHRFQATDIAIPLDTATRKTTGVHRATVTPRLPNTPSQPIHLPKTTASRGRRYLNNPAVTNTAPTSTHHQRPFTGLKRVPLGAHSLRHNLPLPAHQLAATLKTRRYLDNSA
ncbi:hypothetical protein [endosymbiont of Ridgeia piscesae]|uniref:Uncharacterized protein n=1 Tax=endosymbiont of Ridgeia piscesae TaxID=54398 RepID=A0A0T5ZB94_9GAMM|nr:hypothetical protein [endosymbiont of Ridgeia piscesae]KRT55891.1 hypothetical protein Ga0074115_12640 [endosymbiont of Ridgeia piscesae]KRT60128.1 hypothetical protein Ga0076813_16735 [endosymbiont of Ridgeia piscesae]